MFSVEKCFLIFFFSGTFDISIIYNGVPLPDEATIEIDFGDNSPLFSQTFAQTLNHFYSYAEDGHYISKIRIYNDASESVKNILVNINHLILII
jgi:hypothetical protein